MDMKTALDITDIFNQNNKILVQIATFGEGFQANGVTFSRTNSGDDEQYYVDNGVKLSQDAMKEIEEAASGDAGAYFDVLLKHNIIKKA